VICQFLSCFLPLGAIPALMVKLVFRERLRDYGLVWGIVALRSRSILWILAINLQH